MLVSGVLQLQTATVVIRRPFERRVRKDGVSGNGSTTGYLSAKDENVRTSRSAFLVFIADEVTKLRGR